MAHGDVTITIRCNLKSKQVTAITMSDEVDPLDIVVMANQMALRAMKQYREQERAKKNESKIEIIQPSAAAESISALNGTKDAKALQLK